MLLGISIFLTLCSPILGQGKGGPKALNDNHTTVPSKRADYPGGEAKWLEFHKQEIADAKKGPVDLVLLGDSITEQWTSKAGKGKPVYDKYIAPLNAANFGIGGDRTQNVLWRLQNGALDGLNPKVIMLMIGTNSTKDNVPGQDDNPASEIVDGVKAVVKLLREQKPDAKILLLGIFPRDEKPGMKKRVKVAEVNKEIAKLDDGKNIRYMDIGDRFLEKDGTISRAVMPEFLHLSEEGYNRWAQAVLPTLREMLGRKE